MSFDITRHSGPWFERRGTTVVRVRCGCGWSADGRGGASAFGMAWAGHVNEEEIAFNAALAAVRDLEEPK